MSDITELFPPQIYSEGIEIPNSRDVYFRAKQKELLSQYLQARLFLAETDCTDWMHWGIEPSNEKYKTVYRGCFYESALIFYNIVVDLSWVLSYVSIEYAIWKSGKQEDFGELENIREALESLRKAEENVLSPTADESPFNYFEKICPKYGELFDHLKKFWVELCKTDIRRNYNYIKHKGKPFYTELETANDCKLLSVVVNSEEQATDSRDVAYKLSLESSIEALKHFDEDFLFPYLKELIKILENIIRPSGLTQ